MNPVLRELYKIFPQSTVPGAILMAIRGRIEWKRGLHNRIGGDFPIPKHVLVFGKAGTGKTKLLKTIFAGLDLGRTNRAGDVVGIYHDSAGCSTCVGIASVLETYGDAVHFFDEMSLNTPAHIHLLKQLSNGRIYRQRHMNTEPFAFDGMVVAATNGVKPPTPAEMEDFLATLDRFISVECRPIRYSPAEYFDATIRYQAKLETPDWKVISTAIGNRNSLDLTPRELKFAKRLWRQKSCEILDGGERAQFRNVKQVIDIVTFVKRLLNMEDITADEEAASFARAMVADCIHFSPAPLFMLSGAQKAVYNVILGKEGNATYQDIATRCRTVQGACNIHRVINQLMNLGLAYRTRHGRYSTRIPDQEVAAAVREKSEAAVVQESLVDAL